MDDVVPPNMALSLVIPAFNEAARLPLSLDRLHAYLTQLSHPSEVIIVNDGSTDDTAAVVRERIRDWPALRLIDGPHQGKGGAVRAGVLAATGDYVAFADADFAMPAAELGRFGPAIGTGCDIAIGSREVPGAQRFGEPAHRHLMGRVFNQLVQMLLLPGIEDTQCGFKVFRRDVGVDLCQHQTIEGWGFDVELLVIARLRGYRICEVPIPWHFIPGSRIHPVRDTANMVRDVLRVRANARRGVYGKPATVQPPEPASSVWDGTEVPSSSAQPAATPPPSSRSTRREL